MRGLIKPCRHRLEKEQYQQWRSHLCGLCLALRDHAGTAARMLTGYDVLLPSVLVEAQQGELTTRVAGPCALRGGTRAEVVRSDQPAVEFAVAVATLAGSTALMDKVVDKDIPLVVRPGAQRVAVSLKNKGTSMAERTNFDPNPVLNSVPMATEVEAGSSTDLATLFAPAGAAVASVFAHTATIAGKPQNYDPLYDMGDAYGRLVHLMDAHADRAADLRAAKFNPLEQSCTDEKAASTCATTLLRRIKLDLEATEMSRGALAHTLLVTELARAVNRQMGNASRRKYEHRESCGLASAPAVAGAAALAMTLPRQRNEDEEYSQSKWNRQKNRNDGSRFMCIPCCIPCDCCTCCCAGDACCDCMGDGGCT